MAPQQNREGIIRGIQMIAPKQTNDQQQKQEIRTIPGMCLDRKELRNDECSELYKKEEKILSRLGIDDELSDHVSGIDKISSGYINTNDLSIWYGKVHNLLETFLNGLWGHESFDRLCTLAEGSSPNLIPTVRQIETCCNRLETEVCEVIYILRNMEPTPELSDSWLKERIRHFMDTRYYIESTYARITSEVMHDD
ncbi:MAG: hypothetical protein ACYTA5_05190 [Planctomycetota bacterium]